MFILDKSLKIKEDKNPPPINVNTIDVNIPKIATTSLCAFWILLFDSLILSSNDSTLSLDSFNLPIKDSIL